MQKQSLTTSHQQTNGQPVSELILVFVKTEPILI